MPESDARLAGLIANLDEAAALLREHGERHWLAWLLRCRAELVAHETAAFDRILAAFGGMGSFNDLLILAVNGHAVRPDQENVVNERLGDLRHLIWTDAADFRRDLSASP
ncbi:DUF6966 domain-containing protein [Asanoa iriomotensis]|uniref:DUF6966 domain-containing protein n=1 Tax=Asanoa iriomotensis TaxID=234613 RepID=A0ABQ4CF21_9ACTN|nr:hypothetical protein [Asanoa iriomotensis]GIF61365.1 hypothetical protein Air01nite_74600 [Asanoa iriomotensis]